MESSEGAYEIQAHNVKRFTHHIHDMDGELWPTIQDAKRLDDRLRAYGLHLMLTSSDDKEMGLLPLSLEFFLELRDDVTPAKTSKACEPMVCLSPTGGVACPVDACKRA